MLAGPVQVGREFRGVPHLQRAQLRPVPDRDGEPGAPSAGLAVVPRRHAADERAGRRPVLDGALHLVTPRSPVTSAAGTAVIAAGTAVIAAGTAVIAAGTAVIAGGAVPRRLRLAGCPS